MPFSFTVHPKLRLVYKRVWGIYDDLDSNRSNDEWGAINRDGEIADYDQLQDLTGVTDYTVSVDTVRTRASAYARSRAQNPRPPKKVAYVAPLEVAFGTGRIYQALVATTGDDFQVFRDLDSACAWLGLDAGARDEIFAEPEPGD